VRTNENGYIVVNDAPRGKLVVPPPPKITKEQFIKSLDANGAPVFLKVLEKAEERGLPIRWGSKGFSVNVNPNGVHFKFCYGYPPDSVFGQSIYTRLFDSAFRTRVNSGEAIARELATKAKATDLFVPAGNEFKCSISRALTDKEVDALLVWIVSAADRIEEAGLRSDSGEETEGSNQASEATW